MESLETEFVNFYLQVGRAWGLDTLSSKLIGILYLEPKEISIEKLAEKTGYSLASICNKMRLIENFGVIKRIKKPKSKKVFYYMNKDTIKLMQMHFEKLYTTEIQPAKELMPKLIDKYKKKNLNNGEKKKLNIIQNYYKQTTDIDKVFNKIRDYFQEIK